MLTALPPLSRHDKLEADYRATLRDMGASIAALVEDRNGRHTTDTQQDAIRLIRVAIKALIGEGIV